MSPVYMDMDIWMYGYWDEWMDVLMDMDCSSMVISCKLTWQVFYILAARVIMNGQVCDQRETCSLPKTDAACSVRSTP